MGSLLQVIGLQSHDWVVAGLVTVVGLLLLAIEGLVVLLGVVETTLLAFETLLHADESLLAEGLGWVGGSELLALLSAEVVRDKVLGYLHGVQLVKLLGNALLLAGCGQLLLHAGGRDRLLVGVIPCVDGAVESTSGVQATSIAMAE